MKTRQPNAFQRTTQAMEVLDDLGIRDSHRAAEEISKGNLDASTISQIKVAYGSVPHVRMALARSSSPAATRS